MPKGICQGIFLEILLIIGGGVGFSHFYNNLCPTGKWRVFSNIEEPLACECNSTGSTKLQNCRTAKLHNFYLYPKAVAVTSTTGNSP
jgi:hypothetical protein